MGFVVKVDLHCHFPHFPSQALICREKAIICTKLHLCSFENEFSTLPVVFQLLFSFCLDFMVTSRSHTCLFSPTSNYPVNPSTINPSQADGGCFGFRVCLTSCVLVYEYARICGRIGGFHANNHSIKICHHMSDK